MLFYVHFFVMPVCYDVGRKGKEMQKKEENGNGNRKGFRGDGFPEQRCPVVWFCEIQTDGGALFRI